MSSATTHVPTSEECAQLWSQFDNNNNGMLSLAELDKAVQTLWPELDNKPAIMRAYKSADKGHDGFVQKKEFKFFLTLIHFYNALWDAFETSDSDGDRRLTRDELKSGASKSLSLLGPDWHDKDWDQVFDAMDTNKGGVVLFDEFCAYLAKTTTTTTATVDGEATS